MAMRITIAADDGELHGAIAIADVAALAAAAKRWRAGEESGASEIALLTEALMDACTREAAREALDGAFDSAA